VTVHIRERSGRWLGHIDADYPDGHRGSRELGASSCAELTRAIAVTLSLLQGETVAARAAGFERADALPERAPDPSRSAAAQPAGAAPPATETAALSREPARPSADLGSAPAEPEPAAAEPPVPLLVAAAQVRMNGPSEAALAAPASAEAARGVTLNLSSLVAAEGTSFVELGGALAAALWLGSWGARLQGTGRWPVASVAAQHQIDVRFQRLSAALEGCHRLEAPRLGLCAGFRLEQLQAHAPALRDPSGKALWLPALGGGASFALPAGHGVAYSAELQSHFRLQPATLSAEPWGVVYTLPGWDVLLAIGADWSP